MVAFYPELAQRVRSQRDLQPALYGDFDFEQQPDRLATEAGVDSALPTAPEHPDELAKLAEQYGLSSPVIGASRARSTRSRQMIVICWSCWPGTG